MLRCLFDKNKEVILSSSHTAGVKSETFSWSSFNYLNVCQFIGAMNDNTFKLLLAFCFIELQGAASSNRILALAGALYVLPFILLSSNAGIFADRYSKTSIIIGTRIAELLAILFGMIAFSMKSMTLSFLSLFLLATHSAIFGPCKFGIVPEIVPKESLSKANGILTSFSYIAIVVGTFLASFLAYLTDRNFIIALVFCALFSLISIYSSFKIQKTPPAGSQKKASLFFVKDLIQNLHIIRQEPSLLSAVLGSAFFLFVGSYVQLNIIPFALKVLHVSDVEGGYMFLLTAFGIGVGSLLAGKLSGKSVEFGLVPLGGLGMSICCFLVDYYSGSITAVLVLLFMIGFFGGLYLVPLDAYIQVASPKTHRGQVVATGNVLGFLGVLLSACAMYVISDVIGLEPDKGFTIVGSSTLLFVTIITIVMSGYLVRFSSFILSYFLFPSHIKGKESIPLDKPSIFLVPQSFWPWATALLGSQRRRMRFFTTPPQTPPTLPVRIIQRIIPIFEIQDIQDISPEGPFADSLRLALEHGTSVAIFCSKRVIAEHSKEFISAWAQDPITKDVSFFSLTIPESTEDLSKTGKKLLSAQIEAL